RFPHACAMHAAVLAAAGGVLPTPAWLAGLLADVAPQDGEHPMAAAAPTCDERPPTQREHPAGDPMIGRTLGDFVVRERLSHGGCGVVYRAEQTGLGRETVVKILHTRHRGTSMVQRFLQEAQLASRLDHPYAAHVYAFGAEPDGVLWIAMELIHGTALENLL